MLDVADVQDDDDDNPVANMCHSYALLTKLEIALKALRAATE